MTVSSMMPEVPSGAQYDPGALVRARGRDWVVLPPEEENVVRLRPVDGSISESVGLYLPLEQSAIKPSAYHPPDPERSGDFTGALLLRDAVRLSLRSGAGPFRSIGHLSVTPRPYQFVPLIMALRLDPVRLLIADDVGVGKTIEAAMIAREFLDRGIARRIGVLCAPHLCEQWEEELRTKFDIPTAVVQSSRIGRLERGLPRGDVSIYQYYPHLVASIDFVKSDRNRQRFLGNAPDFMIVDEAHTAARPRGNRGGTQHLRYSLLRDLSRDPRRHIVLATATPHSGIEVSFRSLLGILNAEFDVPEDTELPRRKLLPHLIQRKRPDLRCWLGKDTPFPERVAVERSYRMSSEYHKLYQDILAYCREYVSGDDMAGQRQRVRYWAALSILRCVLSSPMAARATLEIRKPSLAGRRNGAMPDESFVQQLMDSADEDNATDYVFSAPMDDSDAALDEREVRRLNTFLKRSDALAGPDRDAKLREAVHAVSDLLNEDHRPIVYCRYIQTAHYVAEHIERELGKRHPGLHVRAVTGNEGDSEQRKEIVLTLAKERVRVLVATDCLSEGINLQDHYDAVLHYDLPWNPNRLEQREGRVDRFGQSKSPIKAVLLYGADNEIDLVVLDVLLRKAKVIRKRLGISVPVPVDSEQVINALISSVLLRGLGQGRQFTLALGDESVSRLHEEWDQNADRESRSRAYFAEHGIEPDEVARELNEMEPALGSEEDVRSFLANAIQRFNGELRPTRRHGEFQLLPGDLRDSMATSDDRLTFPLPVSFAGIPAPGVTLLGRNHPVITATSEAVLARAMDGRYPGFSRSGARFTKAVDRRTAVLILRIRYLIKAETDRFAEEVVPAAFHSDGDGIRWLYPLQDEALRLLRDAVPAANISDVERIEHVSWALGSLKNGWAEGIVSERATALEAAHNRLRGAVGGGHTAIVDPHLPPDVMGCYVLIPAVVPA